MIAEATANARAGAEQFAADSGSRVGAIRRAHQGVFQILARDDIPGVQEGKEIHQTLSVVSTLEYLLEEKGRQPTGGRPRRLSAVKPPHSRDHLTLPCDNRPILL